MPSRRLLPLILLASWLAGCDVSGEQSRSASPGSDGPASPRAAAVDDDDAATRARESTRRSLEDLDRAEEALRIAALTDALRDESRGVRLRSIQGLRDAVHSEERVVTALTDVLLGDPEVQVRTAAAKVLAGAPPSAVVAQALTTRLREGDPVLQLLWTLKKMGRHATIALPELAMLLEDPSRNVRYHAAAVLAEIGADAEPAMPQLLAQFDDETAAPGPRFEAIVTLGNIGPPARGALDTLLREYANPAAPEKRVRYVRTEILVALSKIGVPEEKRAEVLGMALEHMHQDGSGRGTVDLLRTLVRPEEAPSLLEHLEHAVDSASPRVYAALVETLTRFPERARAIDLVNQWVAVHFAYGDGPERDILLATGVADSGAATLLAVRLVGFQEWPQMQGPVMDALTEADRHGDMVNAVLSAADRDEWSSYVARHVASTLALAAARRGNRADLPRLVHALSRIRESETGGPFCPVGEPEETAKDRIRRAIELY